MKLLCLAMLLAASAAWAADVDGDGLDDALEDALLARFAPTFHVSPSDCDTAPAEFRPGMTDPTVLEKNGTIYGQVIPVGSAVEVHYFHLWRKDCGRMSHPLDPEAVAALVTRTATSEWEAQYWFAFAHENTICDRSHGAKATTLDATGSGAEVWISKDKHASFLSRDFCNKGCGHDVCEGLEPMPTPKIVNIGEPNAPRNGAVWATSQKWPLARKMAPVFTDAVLARMQHKAVALIPAKSNVRGVQSTVKIAANTYDAIELANEKTEEAVSTGTGATGDAIDLGLKSVGRSIVTAASSAKKAVKRLLPSKR
jgi:hypothetical protein